MKHSLPILNLSEAHYECTFGRGCDGICCQEGRPIVYPDEIEQIDAQLSRILPLLTPAAQAVIRKKGYVTRARRFGQRLVRKADGWCVFFNQGCVLHKVGAEEGNSLRYKPVICSLFPIDAERYGRWYIRQKGYLNENWDLFCLDPANSTKPAAESLQQELALAQFLHDNYR